MVIETQLISQSLFEAVSKSVSTLTGSEVATDEAPRPMSDGLVARVEVFGGWTGSLILHAGDAALLYLSSCMSAVVGPQQARKSEQAMTLLVESIAHSFCRGFSAKSTISGVSVKTWGEFRESRSLESRERTKLYLSIGGMPITAAVTESLSNLSVE